MQGLKDFSDAIIPFLAVLLLFEGALRVGFELFTPRDIDSPIPQIVLSIVCLVIKSYYDWVTPTLVLGFVLGGLVRFGGIFLMSHRVDIRLRKQLKTDEEDEWTATR